MNLPPAALDSLSCIIVKSTPTRSGFSPSANVTIDAPMSAVSQSNLAQLVSSIRQQSAQEGTNLVSIQGEVIKACGRDTYRVTTREQLVKPGRILRQTQVFIPSRGKTFCVTFSAIDSEYAALEPVFQQILESMNVPASPSAFRGAVGAGLIGCLVGLIVWGLKGPRKQIPMPAAAPTATVLQRPSDSAAAPPMKGSESDDHQ